MVRPADLSRHSEATPAAHQPRGRDAVVRGPERPLPLERTAAAQVAEHAAQLRDLQRLAELERREDAREAPRERGLAGARAASQQQMVASRRRQLQRPFCFLLAVDLDQVVLRGRLAGRRRARGRRRLQLLDPEQVVDDSEQ